MTKELLRTIKLIEYKTFKEKINITKRYKNCKIEIFDKYVYVEVWRYE